MIFFSKNQILTKRSFVNNSQINDILTIIKY